MKLYLAGGTGHHQSSVGRIAAIDHLLPRILLLRGKSLQVRQRDQAGQGDCGCDGRGQPSPPAKMPGQ